MHSVNSAYPSVNSNSEELFRKRHMAQDLLGFISLYVITLSLNLSPAGHIGFCSKALVEH